jgi:phage terminase small subunit
MAGVKGRSGGARRGAGRKPKVVTRAEQREQIAGENAQTHAAALGIEDPLEFMQGVMQGKVVATTIQMDAAKALAPYRHAKLGEVGKKDQANRDANNVGGRFARSAPPQQTLFGNKLN